MWIFSIGKNYWLSKILDCSILISWNGKNVKFGFDHNFLNIESSHFEKKSSQYDVLFAYKTMKKSKKIHKFCIFFPSDLLIVSQTKNTSNWFEFGPTSLDPMFEKLWSNSNFWFLPFHEMRKSKNFEYSQ